MAALLGANPWDPRFPPFYPYIVIEKENGENRRLGLAEAIQDALDTLPLTRGNNDPQEWGRYKRVLNLRFGLEDGICRKRRQVAQELGILHEQQIQQIEAGALRTLRHPSYSRRLREFLVLSPEEIGEKNGERQRLNKMLHQAEKRIDQLVAILGGAGLSEKEFEGVAPGDIPQTVRVLLAIRKDQEALRALKERFPQSWFWNAIGRAHIKTLSMLRERVKSDEIDKIRGIGVKGEEFFKQVLQAAEQKAPS